MADNDVHLTHCGGCIAASCPLSLCPLVECPLCYAPMHECKQGDHSEICPVEMVACLNAGAGCPFTVRRAFLSRHLAVCPASVISCSHERARAARDKPAKKELKAIGKTRRERGHECPPSSANIPIDEALALYDQRLIIEAYTYSRIDRTRRRDQINIREPQLPLREIVDGSAMAGLALSSPLPLQDVEVDSSEDERKIEEARIKKLRGIFADCYMCQVSPATQHFHTLGRSDARWDLLMYQRTRRSYYQIDPFYAERNLMVSMHVEKPRTIDGPESWITRGFIVSLRAPSRRRQIPEAARRSENILKAHRSYTLYTRRCLAIVPRGALDIHHNSQHVTGGDVDIESLIVRCPLWWRGCRFHTARVRPEGGEIRFIQELHAFAFRPALSFESPILNDDSPIVEAPDWVVEHISRFLSGVALVALSSTCKHLRTTLFSTVVAHRGVVSLRWTKTDRCRWTSSPVWSFPLTETSPQFTASPCPDLSLHIGQCPYNEPCPQPGFAESEEPGPVSGSVPCLPRETREEVHEIIRKRFDT